MGKIRVKTLGIEDEEKKQKQEAKKRQEQKRAEKKAEEPVAEEKVQAEPAQKEVKETQQVEQAKPTKKEKFQKNNKARSASYQTKAALVNRQKTYALSEALQLLEQLKRAKFDETVELHINTNEQGVSGTMQLPHGTGKATKVAIADEAIIAQIEKGQITFDILVAHPSMMPKLAKVARILGPKGLMPNPKNGTVTPKPEEVAKKYEGGQLQFKTESKAPVIHLTVGKMSFGDKKLAENIDAAIAAIKKHNIRNVTLKSTMSPGIKIAVS